ncbi:lysophosphatidylserine lipase ABHD12-like isoform X2 [Cylas formicarius]|uniref:lysophosphatidylserine lipase ABHD12-like isoform X2 n=1 Tax=Cylas formicarius TaxID=197179 RepID=UPI002958640D|nr:lysophosphatidylserine lipase ABHD12-like isoform X2 [Cylas formicarius]
MILRKKRIIRRITLFAFKISLLVCVILFVILPLIFKYSYAFQRKVVFLNFIRIPINADYEHPQKYGLHGARNFYLKTDDGINLGVWQILPENLTHINKKDDEFFTSILDDGQDIVVYYHGNGGCRLTDHRIELYKVLRKYFHVIAFDYRDYGDSSNTVKPSEEGVINDAISVYQWVANRTSSHIFVWGHSLGTSISTYALARLAKSGYKKAAGLILEAPFNNFRDEISEFPLAKFFRPLPWFEYTIVNPVASNFEFATDKYICHVNVPIMILHAADDKVVPFKLGYKLYKLIKQCPNRNSDIIFHAFDGKFKYGHKFICQAPSLQEKIRDFIELAINHKT